MLNENHALWRVVGWRSVRTARLGKIPVAGIPGRNHCNRFRTAGSMIIVTVKPAI